MKSTTRQYLAALSLVMLIAPVLTAQEYKSGVEWSEPPVVTPGATDRHPPSDAIILFDGTDTAAWRGGQWEINDGNLVATEGNLWSRQPFGDIQLHLEWSSPTKAQSRKHDETKKKADGEKDPGRKGPKKGPKPKKGQGRGNSGIFLMDRYEVQVLDSFENPTYFDGQASSVYKQTPPMANAMRKPGEWNTYDVLWTAPRFKVSGQLLTPAYVTVIHNGVVTLNHFELMGATNYLGPPAYAVHADKLPIRIQYHGNPVRFRNIWVRELNAPVGTRVSEPYVLKGKGENQQKVSYSESEKAKAAERRQADLLKALKSLIEQQLDPPPEADTTDDEKAQAGQKKRKGADKGKAASE